MILFKPEHVPMILSGRKTQTRREGKRRWNVGAVHACYTRPPFAKGGAEPFCRVRIIDVRRSHPLASMSAEAVYAEGYDSWEDFWSVWCEINGGGASPSAQPWVVEFAVEP
jgi:hypothetical protein